jgi:urease accessory protein
MINEEFAYSPLSFLRLQSWLSPTFPNGAYSYSHGLEWAAEAGYIHDRPSLVDWLEADLCYGSGRNEAVFFSEAYRCAVDDDRVKLLRVAEVAAASRGTSEFALESSQQASACLNTLRQVWPDCILDFLFEIQFQPVLAVVLGARSARERIPARVALPAFLHSYVANLVIAGVRLIPLGQTDLGSAGFMVELASIAHETQYTRLFRS